MTIGSAPKRLLSWMPFSFLWLLSRALNGAPMVLDAGCGDGSVGAMLLKPGQRYFGMEIDPQRVRRARDRGCYMGVVVGSIDAIPFADRAFYAVISTEVIEHLPKNEGRLALAELKRVAADRVVVTTPNGAGAEPDDAARDPNQVHEAEWTPGDLEASGFRVAGLGAGWAWGVHGYARRPGLIGMLAQISAAAASRYYWRRPWLAAGLLGQFTCPSRQAHNVGK